MQKKKKNSLIFCTLDGAVCIFFKRYYPDIILKKAGCVELGFFMDIIQIMGKLCDRIICGWYQDIVLEGENMENGNI